MADEPEVPYWEKPEWKEQLEKNIANTASGYRADWGPLFDGIAERCGITRLEAMLFFTCLKIHWWTEANNQLSRDFHPVIQEMKREIEEMKKGDDWKHKDDEPPV